MTKRWGVLGWGLALCLLAAPGWAGEILKFGDSYPPDHPTNIGMRKMAEVIAAKTQGKLIMEVYPNGQLGSDKDEVEGTIMGAQDMVMVSGGVLGQFSPRLGIVEAPYIWRDIDHVNKVMDGPVGDELSAELLKGRGLRILTNFYYGRRHLTANRAVQKPEDMKGFKLRTPQAPVILEMAKAWGANPTPLDIGELYLALKTGVVDGQENPIPTIDAFKFYEAQKFIMLTGHIITPLQVIINERAWRKLSPEFQKAVMDGIHEGRELNNKLLVEREDSLLENFKKAGMTVVHPDVEAFRKASAPVKDKFDAVWGKGLYDRIVNTK